MKSLLNKPCSPSAPFFGFSLPENLFPLINSAFMNDSPPMSVTIRFCCPCSFLLLSSHSFGFAHHYHESILFWLLSFLFPFSPLFRTRACPGTSFHTSTPLTHLFLLTFTNVRSVKYDTSPWPSCHPNRALTFPS